ncbi:MAG: cyclic nucleotide-binding domain-containing protein [Myxococcota bacterium]|jgi:CRP-like cAMP-binding protein|nr:cyclic nucleotide-binding domain-containing protein [Myxococcota bacterium]
MMSKANHIESFTPSLRGDVEILTLESGESVLYRSDDGQYFVPTKTEAGLLPYLQENLSLSEIAIKAATAGERLSIHLLLTLVVKLFRENWLDNTEDEMRACLANIDQAKPQRIQALLKRLSTLGLQFKTSGEASALPAFLGLSVKGLGYTTLLVLVCAGIYSLKTFAQSGQDVLTQAPTYTFGLLYFYLGMVFVLTCRFLFRLFIMANEKCAVHAFGIGFSFFILSPTLDGRHIHRSGRQGHQRLALGGLLGASLALLVLSFASTFVAQEAARTFLSLATMGANLCVLSLFTPFFASDFKSFLRWRLNLGQGENHTLSYMRSQLLRRQGLEGLFKGEAHHLLTLTSMVLWLFLGFKLCTFLVTGGLASSSSLFADGVPFFDFILVSGFLLGLTFLVTLCVCTFFAGLMQIIFGHLPTIEVRPEEYPENPSVIDVLSNCPLFIGLGEKVLADLAEVSRTLKYKRGQRIVEKGQAGDEFFLIQDGRAGVFDVAPTGLEMPLSTLERGESFGDIALLEAAQIRRATVRALTEVECVVLKRQDFLEALEASGVEQKEVRSLLRAAHAIRGSSLFSHLSPATVLRLVSMTDFEEFAQGDVVVKEGEIGEKLYLIEGGLLKVDKEGGENHLEPLGPGQFFGEIALLHNIPRTATVSCLEKSMLLSLKQEDFQNVIAQDFAAAVRIESIAEERGTGGPA